ncbi:hypothetical protein [Roseateles sp. MS654]|uniref:hypothetical protein n=1 Tax=Roseateles sp. MS654 TaxID=3412685 RepID=UPI003C2CD209
MSDAINNARAKLQAAEAALLDELDQDSRRSDGSGAQERRREEHRQRLEDNVESCQRELLELTKKAKPDA